MKKTAILLASTFLLSACVQEDVETASARSGSDCFHADSVSGFTPRGDEAVDVTVGAGRQYRLQLDGFCPGVDWSHRIALRTRGGSAFICRGMDAEIIVPDPGIGPQRCWVREVRRLGEAEIQALRDQPD